MTPTPTEFILSTEHKKMLMAFLQKSQNYTELPKEILLSDEDQDMAERLLQLDLPSSDSASPRKSSYTEHLYKPELEVRNALITAVGLQPNGVQITRHNIVWDRTSGPLGVKIFRLCFIADNSMVPNGILFLGKYVHKSNMDIYIHLNDEEKAFIEEQLSK